MCVYESTIVTTHHSINHPTDPLLHQIVSSSTNLSIKQLINQAVNPPMHQSSKLLVRSDQLSWHHLVMCATALLHQAHCHKV